MKKNKRIDSHYLFDQMARIDQTKHEICDEIRDLVRKNIKEQNEFQMKFTVLENQIAKLNDEYMQSYKDTKKLFGENT